jgi:hypothetical protein
MTQRSGHACDTLPFCFLYCLIIISKERSWNYCVLQCQTYSSYFVTNTMNGSHVFYKKLIVVHLLKKITIFETEISLQCSQKPSAESHPQTVESSRHFDCRLSKTDFDVCQCILFPVIPSVSRLQPFLYRTKWKLYIGRILCWSMGYEIVT